MTMLPIPADRAEWLKLRQSYIGGSEIASLFGMQPDYAESAFALHHIKAGNIKPEEIEDTDLLMLGRLRERPIAELACFREGWKLLDPVFAVDDTTEGMSATLDFRIEPSEKDIAFGYTGTGALECKNVQGWIYKRNWPNGEPPAHILLQFQHQLACTGYTWGAIAVLAGGVKLEVRRYRARPEMAIAIRERVTEFWQRIKEGRSPPVDGSDSTADALRMLHPNLLPSPADLTGDNELPGLCETARVEAEKRKKAEEAEDLAKNAIKARLGDHGVAKANGFYIKLTRAEDTPDRPAYAGEIIKGRRGQTRLTIKPADANGEVPEKPKKTKQKEAA